jgi:hypothetical protein
MDGSTAATQWKGLHDVSETVHSYNPLMAGCKIPLPFLYQVPKPKKNRLSIYMAPDGESFRGVNAVRLLSKGEKYIDKIIADGYNTNYLFLSADSELSGSF